MKKFREDPTRKKRQRLALSDLQCPMHIKYSPLIRYVKGDGISRAEREVKVTSMNLEHNNGLNKGT